MEEKGVLGSENDNYSFCLIKSIIQTLFEK
jgi:hypothetical protein